MAGQDQPEAANRASGEASDPPPAVGYQTTTFQRFIPKELITRLESARAAGAIEGERRIVTMLFCDVKGLWLWARSLLSQGQPELAREKLLEGLAIAEEMESRRILWKILAVLSEIEDQLGNVDEAKTWRGRAGEIIDFIAGHIQD